MVPALCLMHLLALVHTQHEYEDSFVTDKYMTSNSVPRTNPDCIPLTLLTRYLCSLSPGTRHPYALNIKDT